MRIQDLFETKSAVKHGDVVKIVTDLALKHIECSAAEKAAMAHEAENDRFWSSSIDDVTKSLEQFLRNPTRSSLGVFEDALADAIHEIAENVVEYYSNAMNFAPGYKKPNIKYVQDMLSQGQLNAAFFKLPGFQEAVAGVVAGEKKAAKDRTLMLRQMALADGEALLKELAKKIDDSWDTAFSTKQAKKVAGRPELYDFPVGSNPATGADLLNLFKGMLKPKNLARELGEWVMNGIKDKREKLPDGSSKYWSWFKMLSDETLMNKIKGYSLKLTQHG